MIKFIIEDEKHAEPQGEYDSLDDAFIELVRRSKIAWDSEPNQCPCMSWKTCGRDYQILEYDISTKPYWTLLNSTPVLEVSAKGVNWESEFESRAKNI